MTILTMNKKELEAKIGKIDSKLRNKIDMFGTPIEKITDNEVSVEIFPNRPDLLSLPGFARAINAFTGKKTGLKKFQVNKPEKNYKAKVDESVKKVWPYAVCAVVKGLKFNDEKIKEIIDIQEKITLTIGRKRKKLGLGVYPLDVIKMPIRYTAKKPEDIVFQPLEFPREINGRQILSQHPTGREYGHLLKDAEVFPIFIDAKNQILSMPPIINSHKTGKINEKTKDIFVECTGDNLPFLKKALNLITSALAGMGGKVYAMEIQDEKKFITPDLEPEEMPFSTEYINKNLGLDLNQKEIKELLEKMGIAYKKQGKHELALIPAYRVDILHEIDLAEEIAIAYGYDNFKPEIPEISTIGEENPIEILKRKIQEVLIGLDLLEISTYHLSTKEKQFKKIGIKEFLDQVIEVIDSKTENNILRTSLLANSIQILSENSDAQYPQKIFELGRIFYHDKKSETGISEKEKLCISLCYEKANFTELKQILDYLMRMFNKTYIIKETEHPSFIPGRCGEISITKNNKQIPIGIIGEIHPSCLRANKIKMPVSSLEIDIEDLLK